MAKINLTVDGEPVRVEGQTLLEVLRGRGAMVVMLTGQGEIDVAVRAMKLGAENFLTKPVDMDHLMAAIEKAAEKATLKSENVELKQRLRPNRKRLVMRLALIFIRCGPLLFCCRGLGYGRPWSL